MQFKEGKCPKCFGILQMPTDREEILCMYCGAKIRTDEASTLIKLEDENQAEREDVVSKTEDCDEIMSYATTHVVDLFYSVKNGFEDFKRNTYKDAFEDYFRKNYEIYVALEKIYRFDNQEKTMFQSLAKTFVDTINNDIKDLKKRSKERKLLDFNMVMAVYVLPGILHYGGEFTDYFADLLIMNWKQTFSLGNLGKATFETINKGFKTKLCYITTAVCESLGKSDDCYELNVFRNYRDTYLAKQPDGMEIINKYYDIAPTIVNRVNKMPNRNDIYHSIWKEYLKPCITLIEEEKNEDCKQVYSDMVHYLQQIFVEVKNEQV